MIRFRGLVDSFVAAVVFASGGGHVVVPCS
jgi:hypothetical protein